MYHDYHNTTIHLTRQKGGHDTIAPSRNNCEQTQTTSNFTSMNSAFNALRTRVPTFPYEKRLSKIDTLQLTIAYISLLRDILSSHMEPVEYIQHSLMEVGKERKELEWNTSDLTARLHWVDWSRVGEGQT